MPKPPLNPLVTVPGRHLSPFALAGALLGGGQGVQIGEVDANVTSAGEPAADSDSESESVSASAEVSGSETEPEEDLGAKELD